MTTDCNIRDKKLQYDINSKKIRIGEKKIPPDQKGVIEQSTFAYSPLGKAFEKNTETIEEQRKKISWSFRSFTTRGK